MRYIVDLHTHSTASDGQYTPTQLVQRAMARGIAVLALTDHDTTEGVEEAVGAGLRCGVQIIPGVELSAREHKNFHILGYNYDPSSPTLSQLCVQQRTNRVRRERMILDYLKTKDMELSQDEVERLANGTVIGRPHFAQALVCRGYVQTTREAFQRCLDTAEFWEKVPRLEADVKSCIDAIKASGGKASLAHPYQMKLSDEDLDGLVSQLKTWGLDAIECFYPKYTPEQQAFYLRLAKKYDLYVTGGSDFHGERVKPDIELSAWDLELSWLLER